jgi:hypothetical protein
VCVVVFNRSEQWTTLQYVQISARAVTRSAPLRK